MSSTWTRVAVAATTLVSLFLFTTSFGCGGRDEMQDEATVTVPAPDSAAAPVVPAEEQPEPPAAAAPAPAPVVAEGFGVLTGQVLFEGEAPEPTLLVKKGDKSVKDAFVSGQPCCAAEDIPSEELLVDPETRGVRHAIVYLPRPSAVKPEAEAAALAAEPTLDQKGCRFEPHVLAAMKGSTLKVRSADPVAHNVNLLLSHNRFNANTTPAGEPLLVPLANAETRPGQIVCDIHLWMKAWLLVASNPYFAVTDAKGRYTIKDAPAGTQNVVVWQEAVAPTGFLTPTAGEPVVIQADAETSKDFTIRAVNLKK